MFLTEIEEILEVIDVQEFQLIMVPLFTRVAECVTSSHIQVRQTQARSTTLNLRLT